MRPEDDVRAVARMTLLDALFKNLGQPGSLLEHPKGRSFNLSPEVGEGIVHSQYQVMAPMPTGGTVAHNADIVAELENGSFLYVDILDAHAKPGELKAAAFDAIHLKNRPKKPHAILVFVRLPRPTLEESQVETIGHPFDYIFGIDEAAVPLESKFAACLAEIKRRITIAGRGEATQRGAPRRGR